MFFLEVQIKLIETFSFLFGDMLETEFEYLSCSIIFTHLYLEFGEIEEISFVKSISTKLCNDSFINSPGGFFLSIFELELSHLEISL